MKGVLTIFKYIRGYLNLEISKGSLERFLNLCQFRGIVLWDILSNQETLSCCVYADDFKKMRGLLHKSHCLVHIKEKHGLPFFIEKRKNRKAYVLGIVLALFLFFFLSTYIWDIHIEGNSMYTSEAILESLEQEGIFQGMKKDEVDCDFIEQFLKQRYERISWASVRVSGTRIFIQIKENHGLLQVEQEPTESIDLVAGADGTVLSIVTRSGTPLVSAGEEVKKGQILVSGEIPIYNDSQEITDYRYVRADADISIQMQMTYEDSVKILEQQHLYTGRSANRVALRFFDTYLALKGLPTNYEFSDRVKQQTQAKILGDFYLPFWLDITQIREYKIVTVSLTKEQVKDKIEKNLSNFILNLEKNEVEVVEKDVRLYYDASVCTAKGTLTVLSKKIDDEPVTQHTIINKELEEAQ